MKSILLTSSSSSSSTSSSNSQTSNNFSLSVSNNNDNSKINRNRNYICDSVNENVDDDNNEITNKLLKQSNIKNQVIKSKVSAKDNDKLNHVFNSSDNENIERWQNNNLIDVKSDCFSLNLENYPLIDDNVIGNKSDKHSREKINASAPTTSTKLINLRKKNGTSLIFQRKNCSQQTKLNCEYQELEIESYKKRQSLQQWPQQKSFANNNKNKARHSWYDACNYPSRQSNEEDFESSVSI